APLDLQDHRIREAPRGDVHPPYRYGEAGAEAIVSQPPGGKNVASAPAARFAWPGTHAGGGKTGGLGRNRTTDTRIFSPLLYQLSYQAWGTASRPWTFGPGKA